MRCPHCAHENPDGLAVCLNCNTPLTAYSGQLMGAVSEETRYKAAKLAVRPPVIPMAAALTLALAALGPAWALASRFFSRPAVNAEGTNYVGAAFGAVGVAFAAMVLVPLALVLVFVAWGVMIQRTWAWTAQAVVLLGILVIGFTGWLIPSLFLRILLSVAAVIVGVMWMKQDAREWYGV
jgi:hypothetical protein